MKINKSYLWITILTYLDVNEYPELFKINKIFGIYLQDGILKDLVNRYVERYLKGFLIESQDEDIRDDCGTWGYIYYLSNGMVIDSSEYEYIYNDEIDYLQHRFYQYAPLSITNNNLDNQ